MRDFYDLLVWQKGKELVIKIYKLTGGFPGSERFGLVDQLRRSVNSICANIAEGYSRFYAKDKIRFYYQARGSISESMSHILIAEALGYLASPEPQNLLVEFESVRKMLNGIIRSLSKLNESR